MGPDSNGELLCAKPEWQSLRWHAVAHNYLLASPDVRMLYATPDCQAAAIAFWYPDEAAPSDAAPPPGALDVAQWRRPEAAAMQPEVAAFLDAGKERCMQRHGPYLYLCLLGVHPAAQGRQLGSLLLHLLLGKADAAGRAVYLEATNDRTASWYERHGFVRVEERSWSLPEVVPGAAARIICMERPPQPCVQPQPTPLGTPLAVAASSSGEPGQQLGGAHVGSAAEESRSLQGAAQDAGSPGAAAAGCQAALRGGAAGWELAPFSLSEDSQRAAVVADIISQGFGCEAHANSVFVSDPANYPRRWHAIAHNCQLEMASARMLYLTPSNDGAAMAYRYPDDKGPEIDWDDLPGAIDMSQWARPGSGAIVGQLLSFMGRGKAEMLAEHGSFFYIAFIAVRPGLHRKGLGSQLLRRLLDVADKEEKWTYLEAMNHDNTRFYQRHGFRIREEAVWTHEECPDVRAGMITMERAPHAG